MPRRLWLPGKQGTSVCVSVTCPAPSSYLARIFWQSAITSWNGQGNTLGRSKNSDIWQRRSGSSGTREQIIRLKVGTDVLRPEVWITSEMVFVYAEDSIEGHVLKVFWTLWIAADDAYQVSGGCSIHQGISAVHSSSARISLRVSPQEPSSI